MKKKIVEVEYTMREMKEIQPRLKIDLREKYRTTFFDKWEGRDVSAQHRFRDISYNELILQFPGGPVIGSVNGGEDWHKYDGERTWPECHLGMFNIGEIVMSINTGWSFQRSSDGGITWQTERQIPTAQTVHYNQLSCPWMS